MATSILTPWVRKNLMHAHHTVSWNCAKKYLYATVNIEAIGLTVIAAYLNPLVLFDEKVLANKLQVPAAHFIPL